MKDEEEQKNQEIGERRPETTSDEMTSIELSEVLDILPQVEVTPEYK